MTYERTDEPTPNGGDYSEIYYFDEAGNSCDSKEATRCIIRECMKDGTLIQETYGLCKKFFEEKMK